MPKEIEEMENLNDLEKALLDASDAQLDLYLSEVSIPSFRKDIIEIKNKAAGSTSSGIIKQKLIDLIKEI